MSTREAREKWRQTQLKVQAIKSDYSRFIDSKVVQLVSHGGQLYCLCSDGMLFVWDGEDPGQDGGDVEGWRWLDSPSDQWTRHCGRRLSELARKEAKDGKASPG
jgi:hypothetical protein